MHARVALCLAALLQGSETTEFRVTVRTKDNSTFAGTAALPSKLVIATKFGDYSAETRGISQITRVGDGWTVTAASGTVTGKLKLGALAVATAGGNLKIPEDDIVSMALQPVAGAPAPAPPAPGAGGSAAPKPAFKGFEFRKRYVEDAWREKHADFALLLSSGKHLATLDRESSQCVFVELASGKVTRAPVEAGANHMIERNGKLYVANSDAKTVSVIDALTFQPLRSIGVAGSPKWFTAPAFGPVVYVAVQRSQTPLQSLDTSADRLGEALEYSYQDGKMLGTVFFAEMTPDNRYLVTLSSGFNKPSLYEVNGPTLSLSTLLGEGHWPSFFADFKAGRNYLGSHVYSSDFQTRIAAIPNADVLVPHPSKRLLLGRKCPPPRPSYADVNKGTTVLVLDEETFGTLAEIEIGDRVLALVPTEEVLYVVSESRVYPVELKAHVPAEALSRAKPVRNDVDPAKIAASTTTKRSVYSLPWLGGWALLEDKRTLVASLTEKAELLYIDTVDGAELRRVTLDFQPGALALQGDTLFAIRKNSSVLCAVEAATGKLKKELKIPGDPLVRVACAPKGRVYASNAKGHIFSIDPSSGSAATTEARGLFLQVDPKGQFVYTGRTSPDDWGIEVEKEKDGTTTWYFDDWGYRSMIRKYAVSGTVLRQAATNDNTAVNGRSMVLSPDGSRIAMAGGGGWRPKRAGGGAGGYTIAIYDTKDLTTMLGQADVGAYPQNIAFHPVLDLGVTLKSDAELTLFKPKSMATVKRWQVKGASGITDFPGWLMFAGRGETLLYFHAPGGGEKNQTGKLYLIPLELSAEDKGALQKAYGKAAAAADPTKLFRDAEDADRKGDRAGALRLYRQVIQEDPGSELAKQAAKKILALEDAGAPAPSGPASGLLKTANALFDNGEPERALKYYKRIVDEHPNSPEAAEARKKIKEIEKK